MPDFINTIDVLGDDAVIDSIIQRTITEFKDDRIQTVRGFAFNGCLLLEYVELPLLRSLPGGVFEGCASLQVAKLPMVKSAVTGYEFRQCSNLKIVDSLGFMVSGNTFAGCTSLIALINRGDTVPTLRSNEALKDTPINQGEGWIYVPKNLYSSYQKDTNWSTYAEQLRCIVDDESVGQIADGILIHYENNEITDIPERGFYKYTPLESVRSDSATMVNNYAFRECESLKSVWLPNADFTSGTQIGYQFYKCTNLVDVHIPSAVNLGRGMFSTCTSLKRLDLPNVTNLGMQTFVGCTALEVVDFHKTLIDMKNSHYSNCSSLKAIILRGDEVTPLNYAIFDVAKYKEGTGYFYVPDNLISTYKSAENWNNYPEQFRGIIDDDEALYGIIDETLTDFENNQLTNIPKYGFYKYAPLKSAKSTSVTEIGDKAFQDCIGLTNIDLPAVVNMGGTVFSGCTSLTDVNMPSLEVVDWNSSFNNCTSLESINAPKLTYIRNSMFKNCKSLKSVSFPLAMIGTETNPGMGAFQGCSALTTVDIPNLQEIPQYFFYGCSSLETTEFPLVETIKNHGFALTPATVYRFDSLESIQGNRTFGDCKNLKAIIMGNSNAVATVEDIGCFNGTPIANGTGYIYVPESLVNAYMSDTNWTTYKNQIRGIIDDDEALQGIVNETLVHYTNNDIEAIARRSFYKYTILESADLPNVTRISNDAFSGCVALKSVNLPSVAEIGSNAFAGCTSLTECYMPNAKSLSFEPFTQTKITKIKLPLLETASPQCFRSMMELTIADLPVCTRIDTLAFYCDKALKAVILRSPTVCILTANNVFTGSSDGLNTPIHQGTGYIYVPGNLVQSYSNAENWKTYGEQFRGIIDDEDALNGIIDETLVNYTNDQITDIASRSFYNYKPLQSVNLPEVTHLGQTTFNGCTNLTDVYLPKLSDIDYRATNKGTFQNCTSLESISLPSIVDLNDSAMFYGCTSLKNVDLPNFETRGREHMFYGCTSLERLDLPKFKGNIGHLWFHSCPLKALILRSDTMCTLNNAQAFTNSSIADGTGYIYVRRALIDSYKSDSVWSTYASQFRALEDYTVDGTITGELDETKI